MDRAQMPSQEYLDLLRSRAADLHARGQVTARKDTIATLWDISLQDLGQPAAARPLQERALAIDEAAYGPDHPHVATRLNDLAQILQDLGQAEAASQDAVLAYGQEP
jgi:hypothetical protein